MKTIAVLILSVVAAATSSISCNKNDIDLRDYSKVPTQSGILNTMGIQSFYYRPVHNGFDIYLNEPGFAGTRISVTQDTALFGTSIKYADSFDEFMIHAREKSKEFLVSENRKPALDLLYDGGSRIFLNRVTGATVSGSWSQESRIDPKKYLIAGVLMEEVMSVQKLYKNSLLERKDRILIEKRMRKLRSNEYSSSPGKELIYDTPCKAFCRSDPNFSGGKTTACYQAKDENTNSCCISGICLGCCEHLGCDCYTLIGDYFGWCVAISKACSSS